MAIVNHLAVHRQKTIDVCSRSCKEAQMSEQHKLAVVRGVYFTVRNGRIVSVEEPAGVSELVAEFRRSKASTASR
jgi:hypothetical protein